MEPPSQSTGLTNPGGELQGRSLAVFASAVKRRSAICGMAVALLLETGSFPALQAAQRLPAAGRSTYGDLQRSRVVYDAYILGPGDAVQVEVLDIPEISGIYSIGPDGTIYLPRLRSLYVEGLTVQ